MTVAAKAEVMMNQLRPFWQTVTVIESGVDEEERPSGLIVPVSVVQDKHETGKVRRGVVLHTANFDHTDTSAAEILHAGTVIYFTGGYAIGDIIVVSLNEILAYEES
jgi:hypothetical protein